MTFVEIMVAALIFMIVFIAAMQLWTGAFLDFFKGADTVSSAQEAAIVAQLLRKDFSNQCLAPPGSPFDVFYRNQLLTVPVSCAVDIRSGDRSIRSFAFSAPPLSAPLAGGASELRFFIQPTIGASSTEVAYVYFPDRRVLMRRVGKAGRVKLYAVPRLALFDLSLKYQPETPIASGADCVNAWEATALGAQKLSALWWKVSLRVKAEKPAGIRRRTTEVCLETNMFPVALNRFVGSRWQEGI